MKIRPPTARPQTGGPSAAWLEEVFGSEPRRNIERQGRATTRLQVHIEWKEETRYAEGNHELTAALLLEHLWRLGIVRRWKQQPFNLEELGGPVATPDLLAELVTGQIHVIQVKAKRFVTDEVKERYAIERAFLEPLGFGYHLWTDRDRLSSSTSHTVRELARGRQFPASLETIREIAAAAKGRGRLGDVLDRYCWDDVLSAAAYLALHFDITKPLHENTPLFPSLPKRYYDFLFENQSDNGCWWSALQAV
jgi:hypothetical protein